jgi:hypothetical protein
MSKWIWTVIACVAVAAVAFFGGVFVGRLTAPSFGGSGRPGFGTFGQTGQTGQNRGGGFASGTVLKKDATGLTLKLPEGGSKTVILSSTTQFVKSEKVTSADVSVGATVTAVGTAASDGSVTARLVTMGDSGLGGMRGLFGAPGGGMRQNGQDGSQGQGQGGSDGPGGPDGPGGMPGPPTGP